MISHSCYTRRAHTVKPLGLRPIGVNQTGNRASASSVYNVEKREKKGRFIMPAPRIFISHSSQDADFTRDLAKAMTEAGADAWYLDQHDRGPIEIGPTVERELKERNVFVVVLSQAALKSEWVQLESRWYWTRWRRENTTRFILPVLATNISMNDLWDFLGDFKRVEQGEGVALPSNQAVQQTLVELGITLPVGDYPPDVVEAMRRKYVALGAITSGLGMPRYLQADDASQRISQRGTSGYTYPFQHGDMRWCEKGGAHPVWRGFFYLYNKKHKEGLDAGFPMTDEISASPSPQGSKGVYQRFEGPWGDYSDEVIRLLANVRCGATAYWSAHNYKKHFTWGAIGECYERLHSTHGYLGFPTSDELDAAPSPRKTEGRYQEFEGGTIYRRSRAGAHSVHGEIGALFHAKGGTRSRLGFPMADEHSAARSPQGTDGVYQYFEGRWDYPTDVPSYPPGKRYGATIYCSARGTYATADGIGMCYERLGGTKSALGFPTSSELDATPSPQGTTGRYQVFEGGIIHWCEKYNAVPITGQILDIYNQHAGSGGEFGFPIAAEESASAKDGRVGRQQRFEGGIIYIEE